MSHAQEYGAAETVHSVPKVPLGEGRVSSRTEATPAVEDALADTVTAVPRTRLDDVGLVTLTEPFTLSTVTFTALADVTTTPLPWVITARRSKVPYTIALVFQVQVKVPLPNVQALETVGPDGLTGIALRLTEVTPVAELVVPLTVTEVWLLRVAPVAGLVTATTPAVWSTLTVRVADVTSPPLVCDSTARARQLPATSDVVFHEQEYGEIVSLHRVAKVSPAAR